MAVIPYIRKKEVVFNGYSLKSGSPAYFYFDNKRVDRYVQSPSVITVTTDDVTTLDVGTGLYCNTTGAYCSVLGVSPDTTIYVSENYLTLNVVAYGIESLSFAIGEQVYQATGTNQSSISFTGRVEYWDSIDKKLVIIPDKGTLSSSNRVLNVLGKSNRCNISNIVGDDVTQKFPALSKLTAIINGTACTAQTAIISTYTHVSGIVPKLPASATVIPLAGPTNASMVGKFFYITSGVAHGQSPLITSVTANTITVATPIPNIPTGNTRYSIEQGTNVADPSGQSKAFVDDKGIICGIFNIPEYPLIRFLTGERIFAITDRAYYGDPSVTSSAVAKYTAAGVINVTTQQQRQSPVVSPTPPLRPTPNTTTTSTRSRERERRSDPVAQTFFTPDPKSEKKNYGIFVTSIDIWFGKKPNQNTVQYPVEIRLVQVSNGLPTETIIESATVLWKNVNVATTPSQSNKTTFTFPDPVYLLPSLEYAFVVISDSPDYKVWYAELGGNDITKSPAVRINKQPYSGSMFLSQNGSTWTPIQNWDMMFQINKAVFSSEVGIAKFDVDALDIPILVDDLLLHSSDLQFPSTSLTYTIQGTYASTLSQDSGTVVEPQTVYNYGRDLTSSSLNSNRRRLIREGNNKSMILSAVMTSSDPDISPIINKERISAILRANYINSGGIYSDDISITSGGTHINSSNIVVTFSAPDLVGGIQTTANVLPSQLVSGSVRGLNILVNGSGYSKTPTVTILEAASTANANAIIKGETSSSDGNSFARYQTRKVTLADGFEAGDLRVYVECVRPSGTQVMAYYKVLSPYDDDNFIDKTWVKMAAVKDITSPDQQSIIELEFVPELFTSSSGQSSIGNTSGRVSYVVNEETYPIQGVFKNFAIKLVMFANDPTVSPVIKSMRAIATESG